jgi:hypothetical protein
MGEYEKGARGAWEGSPFVEDVMRRRTSHPLRAMSRLLLYHLRFGLSKWW